MRLAGPIGGFGEGDRAARGRRGPPRVVRGAASRAPMCGERGGSPGRSTARPRGGAGPCRQALRSRSRGGRRCPPRPGRRRALGIWRARPPTCSPARRGGGMIRVHGPAESRHKAAQSRGPRRVRGGPGAYCRATGAARRRRRRRRRARHARGRVHAGAAACARPDETKSLGIGRAPCPAPGARVRPARTLHRPAIGPPPHRSSRGAPSCPPAWPFLPSPSARTL